MSPDLRPFNLLCSFLKGEKRADIKLVQLIFSIDDRLSQLDILLRNLKEQEHLVIKNYEEIKKLGYGDTTPNLLFALTTESYFNTLYSLLENLAEVNRYFYKDLPKSFCDQKKTIETRKVDKDFADFIKDLDWVDEVKGVRDEHSHFLGGLTVFENSNGNIVVKFHNKVLTKRYNEFLRSKDKFELGLKRIEAIRTSLYSLLEFYGKHFFAENRE
jgi:hypothetical protein